jgi:hypothetical protein
MELDDEDDPSEEFTPQEALRQPLGQPSGGSLQELAIDDAMAATGWEEVASAPVAEREVKEWVSRFVKHLAGSDRAMSRQEVLDETGLPPTLWRFVTEAAVAQGLVARTGSKRGTRYAVPLSTASSAGSGSAPPNPVEAAMQAIERALADIGRPASKNEIADRIGAHARYWSEALSELYRRKRLISDRTKPGVWHKLLGSQA